MRLLSLLLAATPLLAAPPTEARKPKVKPQTGAQAKAAPKPDAKAAAPQAQTPRSRAHIQRRHKS